MNTEHLLLNSIITQGHIIPALKAINEGFFKIRLNKELYLFLKKYYIEYKKVPSIAIINKEFPEFEYIEEKGQVGFFINEIIEQKYESKLTEMLSRSINMLKNDKPSDVLNFIGNEMLDLKAVSHNREDVNIIANSKKRLKRYIRLSKAGGKSLVGIPTGLKTIDNLTNGFHGGELIAIMGLPGMGKSYLAVFLAKSAWLNGFKPLYISLEMSSTQLSNRFDSLITGLRHSKIKHIQLESQELEIYKKHLLDIREGHPEFVVSTPSRCTTTSIFAKIIEHKPDICIVDYVSLIKDDARSKDVWVRIDNIMRDLKNIAKDKDINIPIIALAQVHRGFNRESVGLPKLEDVAHSYAIAAHSDIVMALHQNDDLKDDNKMLFGILKNRDDENVNVTLDWNLRESIIEEAKDVC